jgi:hypothetical protein
LNQLIKQVSSEESLHDTVSEGSLGTYAHEYSQHQPQYQPQPQQYTEFHERPKARPEIRIEDSNDGPSWGAFRK